ncbi:uncharacterized protein MONBRDRAFT_22691 [Monosiga brevicollis MX1]|uniref:Uncharacterized protein n=1 Tax=Monosiga brevicollis TaxID=81824 RepID=A9URS9_MONBE|nr:uncharacterized protein MONBRDRAFT_22691 [Monosiga brevicollis MX1]EDQ91980.1 predicted protein [Monosiga brevicollis MX1]|eukprot:XP_001743266.1 hypothetical protein [Monosiga brevicollis MX1]
MLVCIATYILHQALGFGPNLLKRTSDPCSRFLLDQPKLYYRHESLVQLQCLLPDRHHSIWLHNVIRLTSGPVLPPPAELLQLLRDKSGSCSNADSAKVDPNICLIDLCQPDAPGSESAADYRNTLLAADDLTTSIRLPLRHLLHVMGHRDAAATLQSLLDRRRKSLDQEVPTIFLLVADRDAGELVQAAFLLWVCLCAPADSANPDALAWLYEHYTPTQRQDLATHFGVLGFLQGTPDPLKSLAPWLKLLTDDSHLSPSLRILLASPTEADILPQQEAHKIRQLRCLTLERPRHEEVPVCVTTRRYRQGRSDILVQCPWAVRVEGLYLRVPDLHWNEAVTWQVIGCTGTTQQVLGTIRLPNRVTKRTWIFPLRPLEDRCYHELRLRSTDVGDDDVREVGLLASATDAAGQATRPGWHRPWRVMTAESVVGIWLANMQPAASSAADQTQVDAQLWWLLHHEHVAGSSKAMITVRLCGLVGPMHLTVRPARDAAMLEGCRWRVWIGNNEDQAQALHADASLPIEAAGQEPYDCLVTFAAPSECDLVLRALLLEPQQKLSKLPMKLRCSAPPEIPEPFTDVGVCLAAQSIYKLEGGRFSIYNLPSHSSLSGLCLRVRQSLTPMAPVQVSRIRVLAYETVLGADTTAQQLINKSSTLLLDTLIPLLGRRDVLSYRLADVYLAAAVVLEIVEYQGPSAQHNLSLSVF